MRKSSLFALLLAGVGAAASAADTYNFDPSHTYPFFEVSHLGFSVARGRFDATTGKVELDRAAKAGSLEVNIDAKSLDTGYDKRDTHLKSPDFFDVAQFPTITFKSDKLKFDGDKLVGADGQLTLRGVTKPVQLAISGFRCAPHPMLKKEACGAEVSTSIKRSDFGMTTLLPAVGDDVKISVQVEALKQ